MKEAPKSAGYRITDKLERWAAGFDLVEAIDKAVADAVAAEREACALIANPGIDQNASGLGETEWTSIEIAAAIRARGQT